MKVESLFEVLSANPSAAIHIMLPDSAFVPAHFHITEVGRVQKDFIDCGGTVRATVACVMQVWVADDTNHRLDTSKLAQILKLAAPLLGSLELPVEIEYEASVISQYALLETEIAPSGVLFRLGPKHTDCLARDRCGVDPAMEGANVSCCSGTGCC